MPVQTRPNKFNSGMSIKPIRKSNIVASVVGAVLIVMIEPSDSKPDYFFSAELLFKAWLSVLLILLTIMVTSLIPKIRFTSDNWHKPSHAISPLLIWKEPINFFHYVAVTAILSALISGVLIGAINGNIVYPVHVFAIGVGSLVGLATAPMLFKGNFSGRP